MTKKIDVDLKKRLTNEDALHLIKNASLLDLGKMASQKKAELHPDKITSFIVDRNINYTNVCWVDCKFCAFYRHGRDEDSYVLKFDEIDQKIDELLEIGGTQILFQGGVHPKLKIDYYEELVSHIHEKYPQITIHGFSAIEIKYIAKVSKIEIIEVLKRLQDKTGGFRAFIMWSFQGSNTQLKAEIPDIQPQSSNRYLRLLAVSRLYLDNFANMQSSWVTQGSYVGQLALKFGANDLGSTMMEENVVKAAGAENRMNKEEMIRLIKDIGENPAKRNTAYEILERF